MKYYSESKKMEIEIFDINIFHLGNIIEKCKRNNFPKNEINQMIRIYNEKFEIELLNGIRGIEKISKKSEI